MANNIEQSKRTALIPWAERRKIVVEADQEGVSATAEKYSISTKSIANWRARLQGYSDEEQNGASRAHEIIDERLDRVLWEQHRETGAPIAALRALTSDRARHAEMLYRLFFHLTYLDSDLATLIRNKVESELDNQIKMLTTLAFAPR